MHILLVDDHEVVRRSLRQLLFAGYPDADIGEAGTVASAVAQMKRQPWQLMLLDVNLPGACGLEVLAHARLDCPAMAVLVLSAHPEEEFAVHAFKLGAAGYLTKASAAEEMLLAVRCVLSGRRYVNMELAEHLAAIVGNPHANFPHEALSARELEVLRMVAAGRTINDIAATMTLSERTIATYRTRLSEKLGLTTRVELADYALKNALVD